MTPHDMADFYQQATLKTADDLRTIARSLTLQQLSKLSLPEIERLSDEIARVVPAGNVPGLILSGLARLNGREVDRDESQKHVGLLFKGLRQTLDKAVYSAFFAGPAAVLYGYQQILRLAGKDVDSAFPEGTWQFYLEFALREDSARHTNETTGFHDLLRRHGIRLSDGDMLAAWVLTVAFFLKQLPAVLANEWWERIAIKTLIEVAVEAQIRNVAAYQNLYRDWEHIRPYKRGSDAQHEDYPTYRRRLFDTFLHPHFNALPPNARKRYTARMDAQSQNRLSAYQRQLSWLAYLSPGPHSESRIAYEFSEALIGIVYQGCYYLYSVNDLFEPESVRALSAAILSSRPAYPPATLDEGLITTRRSLHHELRRSLNAQGQRDLDALKYAPVLINWDMRDVKQPLSVIRQGKRGVGDHALTIFRTSESLVFDQSHIFFDGTWGAAVGEMMTNEALSWALYLSQLANPISPPTAVPKVLALQSPLLFAKKVKSASITTETGAENSKLRLGTMLALRKLLKQRSDLAQVTVNDLLVLYRGLHTLNYTVSPSLEPSLGELARDTRPEVRRAYEMIQDEFERLRAKNPAILIPVDASRNDPRERVFPTTFRNPLTDFYAHHLRTLDTLRAYKASSRGNRGPEFKAFYETQLVYLRMICGFGELLTRYRHIAMAGQSTSTTTIRFLGHLPPPLQKLLDNIPAKFDILNEVIKGEEVFSNLGRVAKGSTLRRFITAKDDNEQKMLVWGVLTDDQDVVHISLRDFRPHVAVLFRLDRGDIAQMIAQDYLDAYVAGLNRYVAELYDITVASRETLSK